MKSIIALVGIIALCSMVAAGQTLILPPCNTNNQGYACTGNSAGNAITGTNTQWNQQPLEFATSTYETNDVDCPIGQPTRLYPFAWAPGWSYIPGLSHMGTFVIGSFLLHNDSNVDATGVEFWLGWGNRVEGPFTVKAGESFTVTGMAADGFSPPTQSQDYSPYIYVPSSSAAGVTSLADGSTAEFLHGF